MRSEHKLDFPHRRFNPLSGAWVLVSPHRLDRPWLGQEETETRASLPRFDPDCYLCPGNTRAGGHTNPVYASTFVFDNDFPALTEGPHSGTVDDDPVFRSAAVDGVSRVICFSPDHGLTLARMSEAAISSVVDRWAEQAEELGKRFAWVQVFENKGEIMGCSNPHPHGQIWAQSVVPTEAVREGRNQAAYFDAHRTALLIDYGHRELEEEVRLVVRNGDWIVVVPYWATWPYETLLLPLKPAGHLTDLDLQRRRSLAQVLKRLLTLYDNLFQCSFPYSMGWHGRPFDDAASAHWQLHAHFYPPLLRSARTKKFMVGYEMLAEPQRDLLPEVAAERLRGLSPIHYLER
jgi:UDPglucose--hexose-1-phosphate uridylyltransferase